MTARSLLRRGLVRRLPAPSARPAGSGVAGCNSPLRIIGGPSAPNAPRFATVHPPRHLSSATSAQTLERRRRAILTHALRRVHDEGWTDDALASATLDAGLPPSYIGQATTAASPFGSADLVAFFMDECHAALRKELAEGQQKQQGIGDKSVEEVSSRLHTALQARLAMVLPYVASNRWHEGMAIGALPQNAFRTARQLDDMANTVLDYAVGKDVDRNPAQRAAVVASYAAAELHLLSDGQDGTVSGSSLSLSGEQYHATWSFLEDRCAEVARLIVDGVDVPSGLALPNPTHVMAASAVASSLAGAALSLAAPSAAAVAGHVLPRAMESVLTPLQNVLGSQMNKQRRDLTRPSDYAVDTDTLPPFDASEEIFSGSSAGKAS